MVEISRLQGDRGFSFEINPPGIYPPTQKAAPACCGALRRASTVFETVDAVGHSLWRRTMNAWRVPYEAHTSVVGYASEGSALRSMWRNHRLQPVGAPLPLSVT